MNKIISLIAIASASFAFAADNASVISQLVEKASASGWTAESMAVGLDRLDRWYQTNQKSAKFREDLNGGIVSVVTNTNDLTKTFTYSNGTVFVEHFKAARPTALKDRLTASERKKRAEEVREKARQSRIAVLESEDGFAAEVAKVMRSNGYPEELARLLVQHELNTLKGAVQVNATVSPQE